MLAAAEALLAAADAPSAVTMDAIADAAGVGKGTLFRAFGSRDGLLDAVFANRLDPLREEISRTGSPIGPDVAPDDRLERLMLLLLDFKLENAGLVQARELNTSSLLRAPHYLWVHELLERLLVQAGVADQRAAYAAHALLGAVHLDVINDLLRTGATKSSMRRDLAAMTRRLLRP